MNIDNRYGKVLFNEVNYLSEYRKNSLKKLKELALIFTVLFLVVGIPLLLSSRIQLNKIAVLLSFFLFMMMVYRILYLLEFEYLRITENGIILPRRTWMQIVTFKKNIIQFSKIKYVEVCETPSGQTNETITNYIPILVQVRVKETPWKHPLWGLYLNDFIFQKEKNEYPYEKFLAVLKLKCSEFGIDLQFDKNLPKK